MPPATRVPGHVPVWSSPQHQTGAVARVQAAAQRWQVFATGAAVFATAFVFFLSAATDLSDDHFMHVVWGRQILKGRLFVRDMAVLGMPLQSALSALSEWLIGYRLLSTATDTMPPVDIPKKGQKYDTEELHDRLVSWKKDFDLTYHRLS